MQWSTPINVLPAKNQITHRDGILLTGSCFTENIGALLSDDKFRTLINPHGILYNPISIAESLEQVMSKTFYTEKDLLFHDGLWHSLSHHGEFSGTDQTQVLEKINDAIRHAHQFLQEAAHLIITWGSAWTYSYLPTGKIAGNCHKIPGKAFDKKLLNTPDITDRYADLMAQLKFFNPGLSVILTISPVRHWRDGAENNQVSKATLLLAKHQLCESQNFYYFPAFEIVMDELRDYRFYAEDLLHPNDTAVAYIYAQFGKACFSAETETVNKSISGITKAARHRPLHGVTDAFRDFCRKMKQEAEVLSDQAGVDMSNEISYFNSYL